MIAFTVLGARLTVEDLSREISLSDVEQVVGAIRELIDRDLTQILKAKEPLDELKATKSGAGEKASALADQTLVIAAVTQRQEQSSSAREGCNFFYMSATLGNIRKFLEQLYSCSDGHCDREQVSRALLILESLTDDLDETLVSCEVKLGK